jgi:hypothetical protein
MKATRTLTRPPAPPTFSRIFTTYATVCERLTAGFAKLLSPKRFIPGDEVLYGSKEYRFLYGGGK